MPSDWTLYGTVLASLFALSGIVISQTDKRVKGQLSGSRQRALLAASMKRRMIPDSLVRFFGEMLEDLDACRKSHTNIPAVAFFFVAVDTLAFLADPNDPPSINEGSFSGWVAKFLNPDSGEYIYPSHQLFITRCRLFEGSEGGRAHTARTDNAQIVFSSRKSHLLGEGAKAEIRVVSIPALMRDFEAAIKKVVEALQCDEQMLDRAKSHWRSAGGLRILVEMFK
jgi:hypothetical protein